MSPTRSTLLLGALALAFAAAAQDRGKLLGIRAGGDAKASAVFISADRPLSFTTMKLSDPPRVVVDFADTEIAFSRRELRVEDGTVRRVGVAAAGTRTARVVVELQADAEFDVRTSRNQVELRIARPPALASAAKDATTPEERAEASKPPDQAPATPKSSEETPAAPSPTAAEPPPAPPGTVSQSAPTPKPAATETPAPVQPQTQTQTQTRSEARPPRTSPESPGSKASPAEAAKIASLPKVSLVGSAPAASPPPAAKSPHATRANITGLGFRPNGAGEVIVRSDHPLAYGVTADGKAVLLHLPGARIPLPNNRRPLDTRFFDGAVTRIVPVAVSGGTDVRIELREPAEYHLEQAGAVLTVTFSSPR